MCIPWPCNVTWITDMHCSPLKKTRRFKDSNGLRESYPCFWMFSSIEKVPRYSWALALSSSPPRHRLSPRKLPFSGLLPVPEASQQAFLVPVLLWFLFMAPFCAFGGYGHPVTVSSSCERGSLPFLETGAFQSKVTLICLWQQTGLEAGSCSSALFGNLIMSLRHHKSKKELAA